jgi:hypothetical protein
MKKSTIKFLVIIGEAKMTKMMQAFDMFEPSKVLGEIKEIVFSLEDGILADEERVRKTLQNSEWIFKEAGKQLIFMHFISYTNDNVTVSNNGTITPFFDKTVRCISNGNQFFMFDDFIRNYTRLEVKTNEHRFIECVGVNIGLEPIEFNENSNNKK